MSSFCDISKAHTDLLEKDFPTHWGVELTASHGNHNVTLTADRTDAGIATSIKPKHHIDQLGADATVTLQSSGDVKVELSFAEKLPKGAKLDLTWNHDADKSRSVRIGGEYNADNFNTKAHVHHQIDAKKTTGGACLLFTRNQWSAGGVSHFAIGSGLTSAAFGIRHKNDRAVSALRLHHKEKKLSADFGLVWHLDSTNGDIVGQIKHDFDKKDTAVQIGYARKFDDGAWKAKIGSDAVAAVSYTHNWTKNTKVTTAVEFNVTDPSKAKAGVQIKFAD